jgi:hypothetical protein
MGPAGPCSSSPSPANAFTSISRTCSVKHFDIHQHITDVAIERGLGEFRLT